MILEDRPSILFSHLIRMKKTTVLQLMDQTQLSKKQIKYDLDKINDWLAERDLPSIHYSGNQYIAIPRQVSEFVASKPLPQRRVSLH